MDTFMVVATFKPDTDMAEVFAVVTDEVAQVEVLKASGRMGSGHVSMSRRTVFLEIFAADTTAAAETVRTLPMAKWWDLDVYPCPAPTPPTAS